MAYNRRRTRTQNDRSGILRQQKAWLGENRDEDPTELPEGEVQLLENAIGYGKKVEERPGTWLHSSAATLASGTIYGKFFHKASKKWLFHIGRDLYRCDADGSNFITVPDYAGNKFGAWDPNGGHTIMKEFLDGVLITGRHTSGVGDFFNGFLFFINIRATAPKYYKIVSACPTGPFIAHTPIVASPAYRYRYLYTFSRIDDGSTNTNDRENSSVNFVHESGTAPPSGTQFIDYMEVTVAVPISITDPITLNMSNNVGTTPDVYVPASSPHWTHVSVYRTMDIGADFGVNSKTGQVNDPELYVWIADVPISTFPAATGISDTTPDDVLRARISSTEGAYAYLLKSRGFLPFTGSVFNFCSSPGFLFSIRNTERHWVEYCQLENPRFAGYHNPLQNKKFNFSVTEIMVHLNTMTICHPGSISGADLNAYSDIGPAGAPVFTLQSFYPLEPVTGITEYASIAKIEGSKFIAFCTDKTIRIFDGHKFSKDLASKKISKAIAKLIFSGGSVGKYFGGAYLLWYRDDNAETKNHKCIRFAVEEMAGHGWSEYTGYLKTHFYHGGEIIVDSNEFEKLIIQDYDDKYLYWAETYDGPIGLSMFRSVVDKGNLSNLSTGTAIVSRVKLPDYIGERESFQCKHQVTNSYTRARKAYSASNPNYLQAASGFALGFSMDMVGYEDGVESDTSTNIPVSGDQEFIQPPFAKRIGIEFVMNAGGWSMVRADTMFRVIDKKQVDGPQDNDEASYLEELSENVVLHVSRGRSLTLERTLGKKYEGTVTPSTGPDGVDGSAMSMTDYIRGRDAAGYDWLPETVLDGDFTIFFWFKHAVSAVSGRVILTDSAANLDLDIFFPDATHIDSGFGIPILITTVADNAWHGFVIRRVGSTISIYQNGTLKGTWTYAGGVGVNGSDTRIGASGFELFDVCVMDANISDDAIAFYRDDILNNSGKKVLPYF